jgi:hypothetical protein
MKDILTRGDLEQGLEVVALRLDIMATRLTVQFGLMLLAGGVIIYAMTRAL